ncbi:molybdenum cofactor synthesis domain-containing protein [Paracoccus aminovorans]|uniref:Molybdenum cofactor synthesis domain-containing protein n=1 Tax=Paracoccus aminovorans TaxID=34004 RepID=A0A1I3B879_9RHOB|nr:molybdopterin-binding protein [Paracoccus aminovorans]CQR85413.1 molybdopterin binding domain-containing protein [Paracoccus aminovorans]SFH58432.1 molybdenum cofactor synthesis domain-containing protein [Paracoccus aminovorans]
MQSDNPTAAILVIGDEILSGRTREGNAHYLSQVLNSIGVDLREVRIVGDDHDQIVASIRALDKALGGAWDMLFTSGGIGPTHDDITADAVADAFGVGIEINEEARRVMVERWEARGVEVTGNRLRMARIPLGAALIPNAHSAAPGFRIGNTHVMAGVPEVFRAMVEAIVDKLPTGRPSVSEALEVLRPESDVADELRAVADAFPDLSLGSYPFQRGQRYGTSLVIRGLDARRVADAMTLLRERLAL